MFQLAEPQDIGGADLVLLDGDDPEWVRGSVEKLVPFIRRRQMFVHSCLQEGVQLLDDAELEGAVVMAAYNVFGSYWLTSAADEMGETIIGLLIGESGGVSFPIEDAQRPRILAAQRLRGLEGVLRWDSFELLRSVVPDAEVFMGEYLASPPGTDMGARPVAQLESAYGSIEDPSVARLFVDLERRQAERAGQLDAELWAISKTDMQKDGE
ncbi:hypothetical protein [Corynebacterium sp. UBA2622]|uniref:6PGD fold domain-containing protein n=1 Tax=Corynebacterium sp. UBA2622 TaxID=1946393 RepID=UPI0025C19DE3|nr:hypothetical protein [Corynebacterium sp. UBA2622]